MATDLRVIKTRRALTATFLEMLQTKRFEDITVNELCDKALIRRATFYKHFTDKYDFFAYFIRDLKDNKYKQKTSSSSNHGLTEASCREGINRLLQFITENEEVVHSVYQSDMLTTLLDIITNEIEEDAKQQIEYDQKNNGKYLDYQSDLLAFLVVNTIIRGAEWWIVNRYKVSKEDLVDQIVRVITSI